MSGRAANESIDENQPLNEGIHDASFAQDAAGRLIQVNDAFERTTGISRDRAVGSSLPEIAAPEDRSTAFRMISDNGSGPRSYELTLIRQRGERIRCHFIMRPHYEGGKLRGKRGTVRELSASPAPAEQELLEKTHLLAKFSRHLQLLHRLSTTNHQNLDSLFADYLNAGREIFDLNSGSITQRAGNCFVTRAADHTDGPDRYAARVAELGRTVICTQKLDASCPYGSYIGTPIFVNEQLYGNIAFWSDSVLEDPGHSQSREILEMMAKSIGVAINQRNLTDLLAYQARHDALTGLANRLLLRDSLDAAIAKAALDNTLVAVAFIDLDRFKQINDTLGHSIGDGLLQQIAWRLENCLSNEDRLARMGGDEFTAILTGLHDKEEAIRAADRMLSAVRKPCRVEGYELFVTASIGLSFFPLDGRDAATLLRNADSAMYGAKAGGKNDLCCFTAETTAAAMERMEIESHLRKALERDELQVIYQPQVTINSQLVGLELLLEWEHPTLGRVAPGSFIPVAEETGMILAIGDWVLRQACRQMAAWQAAGIEPIPVSVNVSPLQFAQESFVSEVANVITNTGADPKYLVLEITESLVMRDIHQSAHRMASLRALGVKIAIDDFGTGYSSLSYLRKLPVDILKIDQSFLHEAEFGSGTLPLLQTIVALAHNMNMTVTAEGVENELHLELVRRAHCDRVQGHLFGPSLKPDTVDVLLRQPDRMVKKSPF